MPVTIDHAQLESEELGLATVGQALSHAQKGNRLVVHVLIDGREPDLNRLNETCQRSLKDHAVFIETTDPRSMVIEVLDEIEAQLRQAEELKIVAADLFQKNQSVPALEKLAKCFAIWQNAQRSITGVSRLLRIDLENTNIGGQSITKMMTHFGTELRQIKTALLNRDFVTLSDLLLYETTEADANWYLAFDELRRIAG